MKKQLFYFRHLWKVFLAQAVISFFIFQLAFALYATIDAATTLDWALFWKSAYRMAFYALLMLPGQTLNAYIQAHCVRAIMVEMKRDYLSGVFKKNINEFQHENNSTYISALTNDFNLIEKDHVEQAIFITQATVSFITGVLIIVLISPIVLAFGVGIFAMNAIISLFSSKPMKKHNRERSEMMGRYSGFIKEVLSAFHIIKSNQLESKIRENYIQQSTQVQNKKFIMDRIFSYIFVLQNSNFTLTFLVLMFIVSYLTIQGDVVIAGVLVIAYNLDNVVGPIATMSEALPRILSTKSIHERIHQSLKNQQSHEEIKDFTGLKHAITFEDVTFSYPNNTVLKDINLRFEKGKKYLVIGPSGGGKSTILRLLRKYFNPQEGIIYCDQVGLHDIKKNEYFNHIANIEQNIFLFEDTLRHNLTLYKSYTDEQIMDAIQKAGLENFLATRPEGLDMIIQDNGKNISGGEKSRIAIARGLLNKAGIIFLDEAFASLDSDSAQAIEKSLLSLKDVTVVNVSHVIMESNKPLYDAVIVVRNQQADYLVQQKPLSTLLV